MKHIGKSGAALAAAAFTLAVSGAMLTKTAAAAEGKIQCIGVNSCKGHSECKTASSSCTGLNACKGQSWVSKTKAECKTLKGKIGDPV
jgi:uncharacterized membrane protein